MVNSHADAGVSVVAGTPFDSIVISKITWYG